MPERSGSPGRMAAPTPLLGYRRLELCYLVSGPLTKSWEGLPPNVVIANCNRGRAAQSLAWFAKRGHAQIIAGHYDHDLADLRGWEAAARDVPGVRGFLYTTWQHRYEHLEAYGKALRGHE